MSLTYDHNYQPWIFRVDANLDGVFSISDIWIIVGQVFFLPGDSFTYLIMRDLPKVASFLEYSPDDYHGFLSGILSAFTWFVLLVVLAASDLGIKQYREQRDAEARQIRRKELGYDDD
jgi:hypothetical protein